LSFWCFDLALKDPETPFHKQPWAWGTTGLIGLAVGTRAVGLALWLAWVLWYAVQRRKPDLWILCTTLLVGGYAMAQFPKQQGTAYLSHFTLQSLQTNVRGYALEWIRLWQNSDSSPLSWFFVFVLGALAAFGFYRRWREGPRPRDLFFLPYVPVILMYRHNEYARYMLPLIPLFPYYIFLGISRLPWRTLRSVGFGAAGIGLLATYGLVYAQLTFGPIADGVAQPEAVDLFHFIKSQTREKDIIVFDKPRALTLYTDRRAAFYRPGIYPEVWDYIHQIGANYIVTKNNLDDDYNRFAKSLPSRFLRVHENKGFNVWKVL
jgi:hypothetical protein